MIGCFCVVVQSEPSEDTQEMPVIRTEMKTITYESVQVCVCVCVSY